MKIFLIFVIFSMSYSAISKDAVFVLRGGATYCKEKADIHETQINNAYMMALVGKKSSEHKITLKFRIGIYQCEKVNNKFKWVLVKNPAVTRYNILDKFVVKRYVERRLIFNNDNHKLLRNIYLLNDQNIQYVTITLDKKDLSINNFPGATDKGQYYFNVGIRISSKSTVNQSKEMLIVNQNPGFRVFVD